MINHIDGKLVDKTPTQVVIDCNGVGYSINISLQTFSKLMMKDVNYSLIFQLKKILILCTDFLQKMKESFLDI